MNIYKKLLIVFGCTLVFGIAPVSAASAFGVVLPATSDSAGEANFNGAIEYQMLKLDYENNFNYFYQVGLTFDTLKESDDISNSSVNDSAKSEDSFYSAYMLSAGYTANLKSFDNIVLYGGVSASLGNAYFKENDKIYSKEDNRFGGIVGILFSYKKIFFTVDYRTTTNSFALKVSL